MSFRRPPSLNARSCRARYSLFWCDRVGVSIGPPALKPWHELQAGQLARRIAALDEAVDVGVRDFRRRRVEGEPVRGREMGGHVDDLLLLKSLRDRGHDLVGALAALVVVKLLVDRRGGLAGEVRVLRIGGDAAFAVAADASPGRRRRRARSGATGCPRGACSRRPRSRARPGRCSSAAAQPASPPRSRPPGRSP